MVATSKILGIRIPDRKSAIPAVEFLSLGGLAAATLNQLRAHAYLQAEPKLGSKGYIALFQDPTERR
jgi:hypothetical protein